jgi:hypothetical protein
VGAPEAVSSKKVKVSSDSAASPALSSPSAAISGDTKLQVESLKFSSLLLLIFSVELLSPTAFRAQHAMKIAGTDIDNFDPIQSFDQTKVLTLFL